MGDYILGFILVTMAGFVGTVGWFFYRLARMHSSGARVISCSMVGCEFGPEPHFVLRHRGPTFDLKAHGSAHALLLVWEDARRKGIVHDTSQEVPR